MDLALTGAAHCALPSCNELDLLPIRCICGTQYCRKHFTRDAHACPVDPAALRSTAAAAFAPLLRCALTTCSKPSLEAYTSSSTADDPERISARCPRCHLAYCATHRTPVSHSCPIPEPAPAPKDPSAHALLAKYFPSASTSTVTSKPTPPPRQRSIPTDPKKLAQLQKLELMKMRHRAVPGDPKDSTRTAVPVDQRLHVKLSPHAAESSPPGLGTSTKPESVFWFRKTTGTGRALDLLADHLHTSAPAGHFLQLAKISPTEEATVLRTDQPLVDQVEDGALLSISTIPVDASGVPV
ncbi:hypothetical protein HETIRDRAFT_448635 [Heterobasidion irregulare TC 32-1]|uniref:AN1-type domain-containing protein n=1 Tax=Heterobasidion irregulare (strain TC 32-1) TaxID=747525 RepID=W4KKH0_HETIT|nr:uncharacterized protein HETIRDRAFT_448635 [Heterobasidion irregulare TC 32-1]ETW85566.1 hypothetical protein HETIRDRAFT_448635 [Heterobasidion irregulare TC 32-1]